MKRRKTYNLQNFNHKSIRCFSSHKLTNSDFQNHRKSWWDDKHPENSFIVFGEIYDLIIADYLQKYSKERFFRKYYMNKLIKKNYEKYKKIIYKKYKIENTTMEK